MHKRKSKKLKDVPVHKENNKDLSMKDKYIKIKLCSFNIANFYIFAKVTVNANNCVLFFMN